MTNYQIIVAGVGGQGLILTTEIISRVGMKAGYQVKSNDVVGLAQRGGKVWGSVKMAEHVFSPNISPKGGNVLLGMELLEAWRWKGHIKKGGKVILNDYRIPPVPVIAEETDYPEDIPGQLEKDFDVICVNAIEKSKALGTDKAANTLLLGILAKHMEIEAKIWKETIQEQVPEKSIETNLAVFDYGFNLV